MRASPHPITGLRAPQYLIWSYLQIWKFSRGDTGGDPDSCQRSLTSLGTSITDFILVTSSNIMSIIVCVTSCSLREVLDRYILLEEQRNLSLLSSFLILNEEEESFYVLFSLVNHFITLILALIFLASLNSMIHVD